MDPYKVNNGGSQSEAFNLNDMLDSITSGESIPVDSFEYPLSYSFYDQKGGEYEILTGYHKGNNVIKVRYGSSLNPQVLFKKNGRYFLNIFGGRDDDNRVQFVEVNGIISPPRGNAIKKIKKDKVLKPEKKIKKEEIVFADSKLARQRRARARDIKSLPSPDELADLFSKSFKQKQLPLERMQDFGKRKNYATFKQLLKDINYLLNLRY